MVSYRPNRKGRINSVETAEFSLSLSLSRSVDSGRASEVTGREGGEDSVFGATPNIYLASTAALFGNASTVFIGPESQFHTRG